MTTGNRIAIGTSLVLIVTAYMAYVGAASSWQYYLSVDECVSEGDALLQQRVRVSGKVAPCSLEIDAKRGSATFQLEGVHAFLEVVCSGPVPDNLAENREVVVEGRLGNPRLLEADKVLTRCASKYTTDAAAGGNAQALTGPRGS